MGLLILIQKGLLPGRACWRLGWAEGAAPAGWSVCELRVCLMLVAAVTGQSQSSQRCGSGMPTPTLHKIVYTCTTSNQGSGMKHDIDSLTVSPAYCGEAADMILRLIPNATCYKTSMCCKLRHQLVETGIPLRRCNSRHGGHHCICKGLQYLDKLFTNGEQAVCTCCSLMNTAEHVQAFDVADADLLSW